MKRIGIDCRFAGRNAGLGRYTREVVAELLKRGDAVEYILFVRSKDETWLKDLPTANYSLHTTNFPHYSFKEQIAFPSILRNSKIDLLFSPHFNVPLLCPVPFVITIHDLILHRFPNEAGFIKKIAYRLVMNRAIMHAKKIIAVSNFTAQEIGSIYGDSIKNKVRVIGEGVSMSVPTPDVKKKFDLEKPFFLYVGNAKEHKNVQTLIDAFQQSSERSAGSSTRANAERELILVTGGKEVANLRLIPGVRIIRDVSDNDLAALYKEAAALVTASLYEGYCLPVIEALAHGCPVIAANRGAIPEVGAGRAMLIEPTIEAFAKAMTAPIPSPNPSPSPSWKEPAEKIAQVVQGV